MTADLSPFEHLQADILGFEQTSEAIDAATDVLGHLEALEQSIREQGLDPADPKVRFQFLYERDQAVAEDALQKGWTYPERPIGAELRYVRCKFCHEMVQRAWTRDGKPLYLDPTPREGKWVYRPVNRITGVYSQWTGSGPGLRKHWCEEGSQLVGKRPA